METIWLLLFTLLTCSTLFTLLITVFTVDQQSYSHELYITSLGFDDSTCKTYISWST